MDWYQKIRDYVPYNEEEASDKAIILEALKNENIYRRENAMAHMTASAWVVNEDCTKVCMIYHNLYDSWSWMGGHADGEKDLLAVAIREVREESGLTRVVPLLKDLFSLEVLTVDGHWKRGNYVSSHLHLNVTFLLQASEGEHLVMKEDENSGVAWFEKWDAVRASTEPWFQEHVYQKLNRKLEEFSW